MRYAIFGDVHGNLEALSTFFDLIDGDGIIPVCLGDIAGYGACPNECLQMIREREISTVIGNHDYAVLDHNEANLFNDLAREAIEWHSEVIFSRYKSYLYSLPWVTVINDNFSITHSDFTTPKKWIYVQTQNTAYHSFAGLDTHIGFFGHTHIPSVFTLNYTDDKKLYIKCEAVHGNQHVIQIDEEKSYLINPGSLGQPRDRDPRSSFMIFDEEEMTVTSCRFQYDHHAAAERIVQAGLPEIFAQRLLEGF